MFKSASVVALLLLCASTVVAQEVKPRLLMQLGQDSSSNPSVSPNGRWVATSGAGKLRIYDLQTRKSTWLPIRAYRPNWSPAGDRIVAEVLSDADAPGPVWSVPFDPKTGKTGAPQRISISPGGWPVFTPDGKYVLHREHRNDSTVLRLSPARGGEEKVIAVIAGRGGSMNYTPDGKWIYMGRPLGAAREVIRLPATGGKEQVVVNIDGIGFFLGLSPDAKYIAFWEGIGSPWQTEGIRLVVATADGRRVTSTLVPQGSYWGRWSPVGHKIVFTRADVPIGIHAVRLEGGAPRILTDYSNYDRMPVVSPTGNEIAVQRRLNGRYRPVVLDRNGKLLKSFPSGIALQRREHQWSPDGKKLAYLGFAPHALYVLDLTTGRERKVVDLDMPRVFVWRSDSKALRVVRGVGARRQIIETPLDGAVKPLLTVANDPNVGPLTFMGDTAVVVGDSLSLTVQSLQNGSTRVVFRGRRDTSTAARVSPDGEWLLHAVHLADGADTFQLVSLRGGQPRLLDLSFKCGGGASWSPDGRYIIAMGYLNSCDERWEVYVVPLDGGAPRRLTAKDPSVDFNSMSISPDGEVIYDAEKGWYNQLMEFDFGPVLNAARTRR